MRLYSGRDKDLYFDSHNETDWQFLYPGMRPDHSSPNWRIRCTIITLDEWKQALRHIIRLYTLTRIDWRKYFLKTFILNVCMPNTKYLHFLIKQYIPGPTSLELSKSPTNTWYHICSSPIRHIKSRHVKFYTSAAHFVAAASFCHFIGIFVPETTYKLQILMRIFMDECARL